ncbi:putative porin [Porphyromonadaceae bacterium OttesenSCG-928-L07]|nr:putative porin [Porphyromonadaceae bacterium OttesenSCG-928-L07]MDL2251526.1 putative porin [Odoribacter sp. OttesenSCG-928-J03]
MKNALYTILLLFITYTAFSQEEAEHDHADHSEAAGGNIRHNRMTWQWKDGGVYRELIPIDTTIDRLHNYNPIFKRSISNSYLANLPSPYESDIFINRAPVQDFFALTSIREYFFKPVDALEMNTTTPFTQLVYFTGGGKGKAENYLDVWHAQNIRRYWSAGMRYNLISSDGRYMNQKSKAYNFTLYTSYEKERLAFSVFLNQNNAHINENGGVTNKEDLKDSDIEPENVPSYLSDVKNTVRNFNFNTLLQYNIGREKKVYAENDTSAHSSSYPFKATLGINIEDNFRRFKESVVDSSFFPHNYIAYGMNSDLTGERDYKFSGKLIINEHPKYTYLPGLYAGLDHHRTKYKDINYGDTLNEFTYSRYDATWLTAGIFNVDTAALFNYDIHGKICLIGDYLGDLTIEGFLLQYFKRNRNSYVQVTGSIEHKTVNHFFNRYHGNHSSWDNDFSNIKQINLKGRYVNKRLRTELGLGFNNITDYVYMDTIGLPAQTSKNLMILTAWAKQVFRLGHFYFDQTVYVQKSTQDELIDLPLVALYSHNYYKNIFFKGVLHFIIGVDLSYNTKFYADKYAPDIMAFHNQRVEKTGDYPKVDVYMDFGIKRAALFIKYEHVNYHFSNGEYFTALNYPINPAMLKFGLRWNFFD